MSCTHLGTEMGVEGRIGLNRTLETWSFTCLANSRVVVFWAFFCNACQMHVYYIIPQGRAD